MAYAFIGGNATTQGQAGIHSFMQDTFGRFLKSQRHHRDWTQKELSVRWGKSQSAISDYENDRRSIDRADARPLAVALGLTEAEILQAAGFRAEASTEPEMYRLSSGQRVLVVGREGDPGTPLDLDDQAMAVLEAFAKSKPTGKKPQ